MLILKVALGVVLGLFMMGGLVTGCVATALVSGGSRSAASAVKSGPASPGPTGGDALVMGTREAAPSRGLGTGGGRVVLYPDRLGHYEAKLTVGGNTVRAMVDTGASVFAIPAETAERLGIRPRADSPRVRFSTANGTVIAATVRLREVRVGDIAVQDVEATILPRGALTTPLLGMSFLNRLSGFEVRRGELHLKG